MVDLRRQDGGQVVKERRQARIRQAARKVEPLCPDNLGGFCVDGGDRQPEVLSDTAKATLHEVSGAQALANRFRVEVFRPEDEAGVPGDDGEPAKAAQLVDQVLADAFGGEVQGGVASQVLEFQHCYSWPALEPRCGLAQVEDMARQRQIALRRSLPVDGLGMDQRPLFSKPILEALLSGNVQTLEELRHPPRRWRIVLVRRPGHRNVEPDHGQVQAHTGPDGDQEGLWLVGQQLSEVRQFAPETGLGLAGLSGSPELVLQELPRSLSVPSRGEKGDEANRFPARDFQPRPVHALEPKGPHQPDRVNSGLLRHSNSPASAPGTPGMALFTHYSR